MKIRLYDEPLKSTLETSGLQSFPEFFDVDDEHLAWVGPVLTDQNPDTPGDYKAAIAIAHFLWTKFPEFRVSPTEAAPQQASQEDKLLKAVRELKLPLWNTLGDIVKGIKGMDENIEGVKEATVSSGQSLRESMISSAQAVLEVKNAIVDLKAVLEESNNKFSRTMFRFAWVALILVLLSLIFTVKQAFGQWSQISVITFKNNIGGTVKLYASPFSIQCATGLTCTSLAGNTLKMESAGGSGSFTNITSGTNITATMTVGAGATLGWTSTGIVDATRIRNVDVATNSPTHGNLLIYDSGVSKYVPGDPLVQGLTAHDAVGTSTNPVASGGFASAAAPADVSADGDIVRAWALRNGASVFNLVTAGTLYDARQIRALSSGTDSVAVSGTAADGAAVSGNPVFIGGVDNLGNARALRLNATTNALVTATTNAGADGVDNSLLNVMQSTAGGYPARTTINLFNGTAWDRVRSIINATNSTGTGIAAVGILGQFDDTTPTAITENQFGNLRMSANRNLFSTIRDAAGNERGVNVTATNALTVDGSGVTQPVSGTFWQATQPVSGTFWQATQPVSGTVTVTDGAGALNVIVNSGTTIVTQATAANLNADVNLKTIAGTTTVTGGVSGLLGVGGNVAIAGTATANPVPVGGIFQTTPVTLTTGQTASMQFTAAQNLKHDITTIAGTAPTTVGKLDVKGADGDVFVRQATATNLNAAVVGTGTAGTPAGNILTIQGVASMTKLLVTPDSVALPANQSVNVAQVAGTNTVTGGVAGIIAVGGNVANAGTATANPVPMGGIFTTTPATLTTGQTATLQFTAAQNVKTDMSTVAGTATVTAAAGVQKVGLVGNANAAIDAAIGAAPPANGTPAPGLGSGATGGFLLNFAVCDTFANVNVSTATTTLIVTGVSGRHVRICSMSLVTALANNVALISGTGATCGTVTTGMTGGTTAATGWNFAANGGLTQGSGLGAINQTNATGDSVCVVTSAATQLSGRISYAIY